MMPIPSCRPFLPPLVASLALGCGPNAADSADDGPRWAPARTVLLITIDTLNRDMFFGGPHDWDTAPRLAALLDEAVVYANAQSVRGATSPALATVLTGLYPVHHGMRSNAIEGEHDVPQPTLQERFQEAGYRTLGYSANMCFLMDDGTDERVCTWENEVGGAEGLQERDRMLVDALAAEIPEWDPEDRVYVWLHLNHVHPPFEGPEEWYREFHPEIYEGGLDVSREEALGEITLGHQAYSDEDHQQLLAVYAAQIRQTDAHVAQVLDALEAAGRYEDAVIVVGADHGEELATHYDYFWHGCSYYGSVLTVPWAFRAPGRIPPSRSEVQVSTTDVAPTLLELAGAGEWHGPVDGRSLVPQMLAGEAEDLPVFFERSVGTAGVVWQGYRMAVSGEEGYAQCEPYNTEMGTRFPNQQRELFDLAADPGEVLNLADQGLAVEAALEAEICAWVLAEDWCAGDGFAETQLVDYCAGRGSRSLRP